MSYSATINKLISTDNLNRLAKRSRSKTEIKALQNILKDLGYGSELNWVKFGADGDYGGSTTAAVSAFLQKNNFPGDGTTISDEAAKKILKLHNVVDDLQYLKTIIDKDKVESTLFKGSRSKADIVAMQTILNDLGYGAELKWAKYGADGDYGGSSTRAVNAFAQKEGLESDGLKLTKTMAEKMLSYYTDGLGEQWYAKSSSDSDSSSSSTNATGLASIQSRRSGSYNVVTDGTATKKFKRFRKGCFTYGSEKMANFIKNNADLLAEYEITESSINVMRAVSENEGNMDAINTWDNSFMTFGMFQWTIGARHDKGELPSLIKKIEENEPEVFAECYGKYGISTSSDTGNVYGYLTLNGEKINRAQEKTMFRTPEWSFVFWKAGHNKTVKAIQVEHALSRLKTFYWKMKINGFPISDIITSEYGVGLILDNHVNRPGYVKPCIRKAMQQTGLMDPSTWSTAEERRVVDAYIKIRATYGGSPMTHANNRAAVTKKYLNNGIISAERKSFVYSEVTSRDGSNIGIGKPIDFLQEEHPEIRGNFHDEHTEY